MQVHLASETDFAGFRRHARELLTRGVQPQDVHWCAGSGGVAQGDLLSLGQSATPMPEEPAPAGTAPLTIPARWMQMFELASLHADPRRHALLYRLVWRLQQQPSLRSDPLDADVLAAQKMAKAVGHELHKMRAFVRFRQVADPHAPGGTLHIAWFEPVHHIVEANAPWFMRRFTQMRWAILTPQRCVSWDGRELASRPGAARADAPQADAGEHLWLTYYSSIFNPARLKLAMMEKEMPRRYWRNLPEAGLIAPLASSAIQRAGKMIDTAATQPRRRIRPLQLQRAADEGDATGKPASLEALRSAVSACASCPLASAATQAVHGEGPLRPALMIVGEQPGDREDLEGRPFVGPAGELLMRAFAQAGIERSAVYLTNAVRHFKYELRGRRRIHKTPGRLETQACSQWLDHEIGIVRPQALVALGGTAAQALLGRPVAVLSGRGQWQRRTDGVHVFITVHPSSILRMPALEQEEAFTRFACELRSAAITAGEHGW